MENDEIMLRLVDRIARLEEKVLQLDKHFTNHLHRHWVDRAINALYFAMVVGMFCFLKWH